MSKKQTRTKAPQRRTSTPESIAVPPIVAAVACFFDSGYDGLHPDFVTAWQHMPAVVASHGDGDEESVDRESKYSVVGKLVDADLAKSRAAGDDERYRRRFAELTDMIEGLDDDALTTLTQPHVEAAFHVGIAFAAYMLTAGQGKER